MKITGKLIKSTKILLVKTVEIKSPDMSYNELLQQCLIEVCNRLDVQVPVWLKKNTSEFVKFRKTTFDREQFMESVDFDKMEIKVEEH